MRLRQPGADFDPDQFKELFRTSADTDAENFRVRVITPILGGGVRSKQPDEDQPIRLTSINYQLRFWWRLGKFRELQTTVRDSKSLWPEIYARESELFGSITGTDTKQGTASRVLLSIVGRPSGYDGTGKNTDYGQCAYVLFPAAGTNNTAPAPLIKPGMEFTLRLGFHRCVEARQREEIMTALRWWASFGGIGSRTRRGLGSVQVFDGQNVLKPVDETELAALDCHFRSKEPKGNAVEAWSQAVKALETFRQGAGVGRERKFGRSNWPEADSIRTVVGHYKKWRPRFGAHLYFPRAAFGLPLNFRFIGGADDDATFEKAKQGHEDPKPCVLWAFDAEPQATKRLASPLIVKAMALTEDSFQAIALRLPDDYMTRLDCLDLRLDPVKKVDGYPPPKELMRDEWWPVVKPARAAERLIPFIRKKRGKDITLFDSDALSAFMERFESLG